MRGCSHRNSTAAAAEMPIQTRNGRRLSEFLPAASSPARERASEIAFHTGATAPPITVSAPGTLCRRSRPANNAIASKTMRASARPARNMDGESPASQARISRFVTEDASGSVNSVRLGANLGMGLISTDRRSMSEARTSLLPGLHHAFEASW